MIELHSLQLKYQSVVKNIEDETIIKKLNEEFYKRREENYNKAALKAQIDKLTQENDEFKEYIVNLQSEIYGARLAAKYLDKELAGRIQQIQLLGKNLGIDQHERLWNQLEAEIHLHRHKTVIKACRGKKGLTNKLPTPANHDFESLKKQQGIGELREVYLKRDEGESIGVSITGGKEHGVPILISEIHPNSPAFRSNQLFVGDAILFVGDVDLKNVRHSEAVDTLSNLKGDVKLKVLFVAPDYDSDDDSSSLNYSHFDYPFINDAKTMSNRVPKVVKNYLKKNGRLNGDYTIENKRSRSNSLATDEND
jgi:golgi-associated PDZ and coiled-coil motif-containing protein